MEWLTNICVAVVGFAGGVGVAGGVFAFISILGILPRLAGRMGLAKYLYSLENMIAYGGIAGTIVSVFQLPLPIGYIGGMVIGLFSGIFTGALIMALAETLKVIPILCHRLKLVHGLPILIFSLALGKALGSFYQLIFTGK